jgi:flagellum-specific peptidoglycan hydrolase FlgJ
MCSTITFSSRRWNNFLFIFFFTLFIVVSLNDFSSRPSLEISKRHPAKNSEIIRPLTEENLKIVLNENHVICPEQVFAQIMIESGNLGSYLSKHTNNILGMRYPFKRQTTAIGIYIPSQNLVVKGSQEELKKYKKHSNYAVYENWEECVRDYKYWQEKSFNLTQLYLEFLGSLYAEDPLYVSKIKSVKR